MRLCLSIIFLILLSQPSKERSIVVESSIINPIKKADFREAFNNVLCYEGYYCKDDNGSEGYAGLNRRYTSNWTGWVRLDEIRRTRKIRHNEHISELDMYVLDYYLGVWVKEGYTDLYNQRIANYIFDFRNHGLISVKINKRVLNSCGFKLDINTHTDSLYIVALNQVEPTLFLEMIRRERMNYYRRVSPRSNNKYLKAWIERSQTI